MSLNLFWGVLGYNLFIIVMAVPALPWIIFQLSLVARRRIGLSQRLGKSPAGGGRVVWVHAVSVGEVRAVMPMMAHLKAGMGPGDRLFLSTVTVTGHETALRECGQADEIFYFPLDFSFAVRRALRRVRPSVFVTVETEFWPNFLAACFRRGIPVVVVNGRISDRSFRRYRAFRWFFRPFMREVRDFFMRGSQDAERIISLGAPPERVRVTGNTKYDRTPNPVPLPPGVLAWIGGSPVLVAGSTHGGEEEILLDVVREGGLREKNVKLVLVPRHPERFDGVAGLLADRGVTFSRYSRVLQGARLEGDVLLVDAMGLLDGFYALADLAFVGGSLAPIGGHNLLEPAMLGKPVLTGPHVSNFRDVADTLVEAGGARIVAGAGELARAAEEILARPELASSMGRAAKAASEKTAGASRSNAAEILALLGKAV